MKPLLIHTPGEPAGIGPELLVQLVQQPIDGCRLAIADPRILERAADVIGLPLRLKSWDGCRTESCASGELHYLEQTLTRLPAYGEPDPANAQSLLASLDKAVELAMTEAHAAIVTGPLNKAVINQAGIPFSGHTEHLAAKSGGHRPVMMLTADELRVALVTTHLPLREVADAISSPRLEHTIRTVATELSHKFGLSRPRVAVCGLNPHAGENGHMGMEEIEIIEPVIAKLERELDAEISGPWPADTIFTQKHLKHYDAVVTMFHDQGLPTLKHAGFGRAVNVTLGLPIIRCSVDHGTAFDLAGSGKADSGSLRAAEQLAMSMAQAHG